MLKFSSIILLALFPFTIFSQVAFQNISFQDAIKQASSSGKLIFIQFESNDCNRCNQVADKAFEDKNLASQLEQTFICMKIDATNPERKMISRLYNLEKRFGSLFIDQNKTLIHSYLRTTTFIKEYEDQIDIALSRMEEGKQLNELEKQYQTNESDFQLLETLLQKRKILDLETDSLLERFVTLLPSDSLKSADILQFIAQMAPAIGSWPDSLLHQDRTLFSKCWYAMDLQTRIAINNRIINKSLQKAIRENNESFAARVAQFARLTYSDKRSGSKAFESNMMSFYKETNDTLKYIIAAMHYYDTYYMSISVDSIKAIDSINLQKAIPIQIPDVTKNNNSVFMKEIVRVSPTTQFYTQYLNTGALSFYKMTNKRLYLEKALEWAK